MPQSSSVRPSLIACAAALAAAVLLAPLTPSDAEAQQRSRTRGPMIGGHVLWSSTTIEDADRSSGAGLGAVAAYGFGSGLGIFGQFDRSNIDVRNQPEAPGEWEIWHVDLGLRYHFGGPEKTVVPFAQAAGTLRDVHVTEVGDVGGVPVDEIDLRGFAGSIGAGVQAHVSTAFAFNLSALFTFGSLTEGAVDGVDVDDFDISAQSFRMHIGVVWWPIG